MTIVDTNVILDILTGDPTWLDWSVAALDQARQSGPLHMGEITYAELAVRMAAEGDLLSALRELAIGLDRIPPSALFVAGRAFFRYRMAGGPRTTILPDLLIGAHAAALAAPILTREVRRFRSYFPEVRLIAPQPP